MRTLRQLLLVLLAVAAPAVASAQYAPRPGVPGPGPVYMDESVADAAHRLSRRAANLYRITMRMQGYSHLSNDSLNLARAAERFHQSVEGAARGPRDVLNDFMILQQQYYHLRGEFFRAHRAHHIPIVVDHWASMVQEFERLALTLGVPENQLCALPPGQGYYRGAPYGRGAPYRVPRGQYGYEYDD